MSGLEKRKVELIETHVCLAPNLFKKHYGIKVRDDTYEFVRQCITTKRTYVDLLIYKILANDVQNVHIEDVVDDFMFENDLE